MEDGGFERRLTRLERQAKKQKQKQKGAHYPEGQLIDGNGAGCFWLILLLLIALFVVFIIIAATRPWPPPLPLPLGVRNAAKTNVIHTKHNVRLLNGTRPKTLKTECTLAGEVFDAEANMCGPIFHAPLALDASIMDPNVNACDSFYGATCGIWRQQHTNANRAFTYAYLVNMERVKKMITQEVSTTGVGVGVPPTPPLNDFYTSCLAPNRKETILEYKHAVEVILGGMRTHADLPTVFGRLAQFGYTAPWAFSIERHPTEPRLLPVISLDMFPVAAMSDGQVYQLLADTRDMTNYNILELQQRIQSVLAINRALRDRVSAHPTPDGQGLIVPFSTLIQDWNLRAYTPVRGWNLYFQALDGASLRFLPQQDFWVENVDYINWLLGQGIAAFTIQDWRAYVEFSILYNGNQFEPELVHDVYYKEHDRNTRSTHKLPDHTPVRRRSAAQQKEEGEEVEWEARKRVPHRIPRGNTTYTLTPEQRCLRITHHMLPGIVAKTFMTRYFIPSGGDQIKADVRKMLDRMLAAYSSTIDATPWLSPADKLIIHTKMNATLVRVAEPDEWEAEPFAARIARDRYDHNMNLVRRYRVHRNLALWHKDAPNALDRNALAFFAIPLTETNAYYSPHTNTITILAGILQPPFYSLRYNEVTKHAILASIIGHELTHMLDHHGLYWDAQGSYVRGGILSSEGMRAFYDRTDCIILEYGPAPGGCEDVNVAYGNATVGEDLADLTGISLSYKAYFYFTDVGRAAGLSDKQHFFMVLSQAFCESYDQAHICAAVASDVHAIAEFRIDRTFRNMPAFQEAFHCSEGQNMYKNAGGMCRVYGG
jgi:predicted metalloendopeptidase